MRTVALMTVVSVFAGACKQKPASGTSAHDAGVAKAEESAPIAKPAPAAPALPPPAAGTTRLTHEALVLDVKGSWRSTKEGEMLSASPEGVADAAILMLPAIDLGGASLADALVRGIDASTKGRTLVKALPAQPEVGTTRAGVAYASQFRQTRGATGDEMNAMYYLYDVGGRGQVVVALAVSKASFKLVATAVVAREMQVIAAPVAPSVGVPTGAGSEYETTAVGSTAYVASVGDSPKLTPVPFRIGWAHHYPNLTQGYTSSYGFFYGRDGQGNTYVYNKETIVPTKQATVFRFPASRHESENTGVDYETFSAAVTDTTGDQNAPVREFDTVETDLAGDLFVGGPAHGWPNGMLNLGEYLVWRPGAAKAEAVVTHLTLEKLGRKPVWDTSSYFRTTPQGDAWLFVVTDGWPRVLYFSHGAGGWSQREIDISRFSGGGQGPTPTIATLIDWGATDFTGGWVFHSNGAFWRISRDGGPIRPILRMDLPTKGVMVSNPIVLENGDIWFAALGDNSVVTYVGPDDWGHGTTQVQHQSILLGDRSRWIRARLDGKGGVALGEIDGEAITAALRKAGARVEDDVFETRTLELDLASGGIFTFDSHHELLYVLEPTD